MTDKELLELAAKAGGLEVVTPTMLAYGQWNPLTDDGDALRLAVKLHLSVHQWDDVTCVCTYLGTINEDVVHDDDPYAATRRAIVRAAAEIGRTK